MEKYNKLLRNIAELIEKGLFTSKDLKKYIEDSIKFKIEIIANKLNLVSREEFEVQKKAIEKLQKDLIQFKFQIRKYRSNKKTTKAKKP
jgi:BMFP domain-containing protein YqiC